MKKLLTVLVTGTFIVGSGAAIAAVELNGTVNGGGYYRDGATAPKKNGKGNTSGKSKQAKTQLSVAGIDDTDGDSGRVLVSEHKPGAKPTTKLALELDCVTVDDDTAYASGTDADGNRHYVVVEDNAEPGRNKDGFGTSEDSPDRTLFYELGIDCGAGTTPLGGPIATAPIDGGNFQVRPAE